MLNNGASLYKYCFSVHSFISLSYLDYYEQIICII